MDPCGAPAWTLVEEWEEGGGRSYGITAANTYKNQTIWEIKIVDMLVESRYKSIN